MTYTRLIARLDIKGENLIKGINLEGLRVIGPPPAFAKKYYWDGIDELIMWDTVATLYGRNHLHTLVQETVKDVYVPLTVGGGIRSLRDAEDLFSTGADKVAINTQAIHCPQIISDIASQYGSQAFVLSVEAKSLGDNRWEAYTHNGREPSGLDVLDWCKKAVEFGAGEILLTSVDREGTRLGFDIDLVSTVTSSVSIPVIASGGMGKLQHAAQILSKSSVSGLAIADMLHYNRTDVRTIRDYLLDKGFSLRKYDY